MSSTPGIHDPVDRAARHDADLTRAKHLETVGVDAFVAEWLELDLFAPYVAGLDADDLTATIEQRTSNTATGLANSLRGTGTGAMTPVWLSLPALRSPLLAIAGGLDDNYVQIAERMATAAPFGEMHVVANAGHVVHVENCAEVAARVSEFLRVCEDHADLRG